MSARPYLESVALIALLTSLGLAIGQVLQPSYIDTAYLLIVLVIALRWGRWPAMFTAVLSALVFDFCFVVPRYSFAVTDLPYLTTLVGFFIVALATSELASRSRQSLIEQAAAEARTEAKDAILNRVCHELRSPLSALRGWTQLLTRPGVDSDRVSKAVAGIDRSGQMLVRLVDDLMCATRISSGKLVVERHPTMLEPVIASSVSNIRDVAHQKGVHIDAAIEPVGIVLADAQRIDQIATNLLSNAIKFTEPGGRVSLRLHRLGPDAELVVSDTGIGITADFLPHVFEAFAQADKANVQQGLGLGLSIANQLVRAHGGTIAVTSGGAGRGTTFTVHLPLSSNDAGAGVTGTA